MISEEEALRRVLQNAEPLGAETAALEDAAGRFIAEEIRATIPIPRFDNSAMDGYAVRAADRGKTLRLAGEQPAGADRRLELRPGEAIRIFTGAPMPAGADAVAMQEDARADEGQVFIAEPVEIGENVRRAGADLCAGQRIAQPGDPVTPQLLALLASQGLSAVKVGRRAHVAILATGDELAAPGEPLGPGAIHDTNSVMLAAMAARLGAHVTRLGIAPDEPGPLRALLEAGCAADALLISGGVSVGERDLARQTLLDMGTSVDVWRVSVRPGKPFLFGTHGACRIFGLPGNPVSSFVTFHCFARPALLKMMSARDLAPPRHRVALACDVANSSERPHYLRGAVADGIFTPVGRQESHALAALSRSNALLRLAPGAALSAGDAAEAVDCG